MAIVQVLANVLVLAAMILVLAANAHTYYSAAAVLLAAVASMAARKIARLRKSVAGACSAGCSILLQGIDTMLLLAHDCKGKNV